MDPSVLPKVFITTKPAASTTSTIADFNFAASGAGNGTIVTTCQLDAGSFTDCSGGVSYSGLSVASHSFNVKVGDPAGNQAVASYTWEVTALQPNPPSSPMASTTPPLGPNSGPNHNGVYTISGQSNVVIDAGNFTSSNDVCIKITNSTNITIQNISAIHCYGVGVLIENSSKITVQNSYFEDLNGGVYASNSSFIVVKNNRLKNVGRVGKLDPSRGQFVQFDNVNGAGNEVSLNRGINIPGQSTPEDLINLFMTNGTLASPVLVQGNCFQGGGPSTSGGGLAIGDYGGSNIIVQNNTLVNPGQYGIAVASGTNIQILNNQVYGMRQSFTNIGMYVWNQTKTPCSNITVQNNSVDFTNSSGTRNSYWNAGNCGVIAGESNNNFSASLSSLSCTLN